MLEVTGLSKQFGKGFSRRKAFEVKNVSFSLGPGRILGLTGPSGSGKSTIARLVSRLIPADRGKVLLSGRDLLSLSAREFAPWRRKIQMIFQQPNLALDPGKRIIWSLCEPLIFHGLAKSPRQATRMIRPLLDETGLSPEILNRFPAEISGGQAQRVVIARALSLGPRYLIADEATSMLDLSVQAMVLSLLRELQAKRNLGIILISHDPQVVGAMCQEVIHLDNGRIVKTSHLKPEPEADRLPIPAQITKHPAASSGLSTGQ